MKTDTEKLAEVEDLFSFIMKVQPRLSPMVATQQEATDGQGRIGVIMIKGGDGSNWSRVFEVCGNQLIPRDSVDGARTVIVFNSVDSFRSTCQELMAGRSSAFARARARGDVKVVGDFAVRDAVIFNRLLTRVGEILSNYNVKFGE